MSRHHFYSYIQDTGGNRVETASIYIYKAGTDTGATIFDAESGGTSTATVPQCLTASSGLFNFWIDDETYSRTQEFKIIAKKDGLVTASIDNVIVNWTPDGWIKKVGAYTARAGDRILFDTTATKFTITMPSSPAEYDTIRFRDCGGYSSTNNLTLNRNSENIRSVATNLVVDVDWCDFEMTYVSTTVGWGYPNG